MVNCVVVICTCICYLYVRTKRFLTMKSRVRLNNPWAAQRLRPQKCTLRKLPHTTHICLEERVNLNRKCTGDVLSQISCHANKLPWPCHVCCYTIFLGMPSQAPTCKIYSNNKKSPRSSVTKCSRRGSR